MDAEFLDLTLPTNESGRRKTVEDDATLIRKLQEIAGPSHVLTSPEATRRFRTGIRFGSGPVAAVVRPGVGSHLGVRIWNFGPKKPSNGVCLTFRAGHDHFELITLGKHAKILRTASRENA
jgi:hypothetical protein